MGEKLRVAIVGTGYFSAFHFDAWSRCPEVEIVGVAGLELESVTAIAEKYGIGGRFSDVASMLDATTPDLLDIITPPPTHLGMISIAAEHGIDAVCQKPFCGDIQVAEQAIAVAKKHDIVLTVHENFRFQPWYTAIKRELDLGRIGQFYRAHFRLRPGDGQGIDAYLERQPYFQKMPRFLVHETAVHHMDVARYFFGEPNTVFADMARLNPVIVGEDSAIITLGFSGGFRAIIDGNRLSDHKAKDLRRTMGELLIEGEKGCIRLDGDGAVWFRAMGENNETKISFEWNNNGFGGDCVYLFTRHVVDHYVSGSALANSGESYLANLRLEEAAYACSKDGRRRVL